MSTTSANEKTHFRKAFDSPYLSAADIVGVTPLTIRCVTLEKDKTKKTGDYFNTAYFVEAYIRRGEKLKPMILNATNSKMLKQLSGSSFIEDWAGLQIAVFVDQNVRFGKETVEGLRVCSYMPGMEGPSQELLDSAEAAASGGADSYQKFWSNTGKDNRKLLAGEHDRLKAEAAAVDKARTVEPEAKAAEPTGEVTPDQVLAKINAATNEDALYVAADWVNSITDNEAVKALNARVDERLAELRG